MLIQNEILIFNDEWAKWRSLQGRKRTKPPVRVRSPMEASAAEGEMAEIEEARAQWTWQGYSAEALRRRQHNKTVRRRERRAASRAESRAASRAESRASQPSPPNLAPVPHDHEPVPTPLGHPPGGTTAEGGSLVAPVEPERAVRL